MATSDATGFDITTNDSLKQGVIAGSLGASAMIARQLLSTDRPSWGTIVRSCLAASITAYFVNFASREHVTSESLRVCCCGIAGFASPEILNYLLAYIKAKGQTQVAKAQSDLNAARKASSKKSKGKSRHAR